MPSIVSVLAAVGVLAGPSPSPDDKYLETIKVSENVYVFKPKIDWTHGNGVAIVGPDGVFFIDTYIQPNYAEEAIRRLKKITSLPVRLVLNTHWHYDHVVGNGIFKQAFPDCRFIAHDSTAAIMERRVRTYLEKEPENIASSLTQLTKEIKDGKTQGEALIIGSMRPFWQWMLREAEEYQRAYHPIPYVPIDRPVRDTLTMPWGNLTLQIIHMADNGHSPGDLVVWIPERRLLVAGDLVVAPTPYATYFNSPGMVRALKKLEAMNPAIIIPGHGPVEHDLTYLRLLVTAFGEYRRASETALAAGVPLKQALDSITFPDIDRRFTGNDPLKQWAYRSFFRGNLIYYTYKPPAPTKPDGD
jgi:cyclase